MVSIQFDEKKKRYSLIICAIFFLFCSVSITNGLTTLNETDTFQMNSIEIQLDCNSIDGLINDFAEINCGPIPNPDVNGVDLTQQFKKTGLHFVRTHDFGGPTDISNIFPDFSEDPTIPANYNFTLSDKYISSIINADCQVFYRLGESANTIESLRQPPENMSKWAEICKHIAMHYNDGWAEGFYYNVTYWEIWNEPDLQGFWNGTVDDYYKLYHVTAKTLKQYDSNLKIGGPCTSSISNQNFSIRFLSYVKQHQIPLDFYSWHMYADTPYQLYNGSLYVRTLLDSVGCMEVENINTEWNCNILFPQRDKDNAKNAAFTACCLTAFQEAGIDYAFRYRATQDNNPLTRFIGFDLSLFSSDGLFKTPALTYLAMQYLVRDSPIKLQYPIIDEEQQLTCLAGISKDETNMTLLLSNYDEAETNFKIIIDHISFNSSYTVATMLIDDNHHLQIVDEYESNSDILELTQTVSRSSVQLIRITNSSILPDEGPATAIIPWFLRIPLFDPIAKILAVFLMIIFFG